MSPQSADYLARFRTMLGTFDRELHALRSRGGLSLVTVEDLVDLTAGVRKRHDELHGLIFADISTGAVGQDEVSSLLNVNREILNSCLSMIDALSDYCLEPAQADVFNRLPGVS